MPRDVTFGTEPGAIMPARVIEELDQPDGCARRAISRSCNATLVIFARSAPSPERRSRQSTCIAVFLPTTPGDCAMPHVRKSCSSPTTPQAVLELGRDGKFVEAALRVPMVRAAVWQCIACVIRTLVRGPGWSRMCRFCNHQAGSQEGRHVVALGCS
jgi:hypothetical protein